MEKSISFETLTILAFLIPGFIFTLILDSLCFRKDREFFQHIVEALVVSFMIYWFIAWASGSGPVILAQKTEDKTTEYSIRFDAKVVAGMLALPLFMALIFALTINRDWHTRLCRKLGVTQRTSHANIWLDVFHKYDCYIIVNFTDGRRLFGWPMFYPNSSTDGCMYISNPSWIDGSKYIELDLKGLLLVKTETIDFIEFTNITADNAKERVVPQEGNPND